MCGVLNNFKYVQEIIISYRIVIPIDPSNPMYFPYRVGATLSTASHQPTTPRASEHRDESWHAQATVDLAPSQLTSDNLGAGVDVLGWNRPVQLEEDARVGGLVGAGEGDKSAVGVDSAGAAGDVDLGACDVDLDTTNAGGAVQSDVLHAEEVLAVLDAAGNGDRYGLLACRERNVNPILWTYGGLLCL